MSKPTTKEKELVVNRVFEHILAINDKSKLLKVEETIQKRSDKKKEQEDSELMINNPDDGSWVGR